MLPRWPPRPCHNRKAIPHSHDILGNYNEDKPLDFIEGRVFLAAEHALLEEEGDTNLNPLPPRQHPQQRIPNTQEKQKRKGLKKLLITRKRNVANLK